ncbi:MAG TPA: GGDEF domain-containing protein [Candidatus Omnitrophica bacterium]|nr:GGDEF domain-containing protein [Candidatus Omnitrophota bacterium]
MLLLVFLLVLSSLIIIRARIRFRSYFLEEQNKYRDLQYYDETLRRNFKDLNFKEELLGSEYENITTLYEVTKDISKTLNMDEVFHTFRGILKNSMDIDDCVLTSSFDKKTKGDYPFTFPLDLGKNDTRALFVKGMRVEDKDKFIILANQFALVFKRAQLYRTIQELSITDSLTQILVKRYCMVRFNEEFLRSERKKLNLSCLMLDVDNFKDYNDRFGHLVGDVILAEVARMISDSIREIDLLGRFGGEEFLLILPETDKQEALFVAERIRKTVVERVIKAYDEVLRVTLSIGVTTFPQDGQDTNELIDRADRALYQAKHVGKNRVCLYSPRQSKG